MDMRASVEHNDDENMFSVEFKNKEDDVVDSFEYIVDNIEDEKSATMVDAFALSLHAVEGRIGANEAKS